MSALKPRSPPKPLSRLTLFVSEHQDDAREFGIVIKAHNNRFKPKYVSITIKIGDHTQTYDKQIRSTQLKVYLNKYLGTIATCIYGDSSQTETERQISVAKVAILISEYKTKHKVKKIPQDKLHNILNTKETITTWSYTTKWKLK